MCAQVQLADPFLQRPHPPTESQSGSVYKYIRSVCVYLCVFSTCWGCECTWMEALEWISFCGNVCVFSRISVRLCYCSFRSAPCTISRSQAACVWLNVCENNGYGKKSLKEWSLIGICPCVLDQKRKRMQPDTVSLWGCPLPASSYRYDICCWKIYCLSGSNRAEINVH